jgi:hypothetical protein
MKNTVLQLYWTCGKKGAKRIVAKNFFPGPASATSSAERQFIIKRHISIGIKIPNTLYE